MNVYLVMKNVLTLLLLAMFAYGIISIQSGRVYCKGCWYERRESPIWFWSTIAIYLVGPPIILFLVWTAT
jgi:hypothetical protein